MSFHRPYPWTPMHPDVPMLGQAVTPEEALLTTAAVAELQNPTRPSGNGNGVGAGRLFLVGAGILAALAVAYYVAGPSPTPNPRRRRRRTSKRRRRTSRRRARTSKNPHAVMANPLTAAARKRIPLRCFVFPQRRAWPLNTRRRARAAISYMQMGRVKNASDFNAIRNKLRRLWPDVWDEYGRGRVSWEKVKRAKAKRARTRRRRPRRRRAA